ncbi:MAG: YggS family pyridoxal phosphate-dependent enzyme [Lachnospiraceae bacterium]|nr:YggS family pyridoxal phosphate-dependent enzyme [Lachnospiraceae bacterium]
MLIDNLNAVKDNIAEACAKVGRDAGDVTLLAVSKTKPEADIMELYEAGHRDFGENYVQELREKQEHLPKDINWHMIGHLQKNKVKYIAPYVAMIHSVDSLELAAVIDKEAAKHNRIIPILVEVNVGGEESKFGISAEEAPAFVAALADYPHIRFEGLMTSAPFLDDPEDDRPFFAELRKLSVDINSKNLNNMCGTTLSMGMSNDYKIAVEEGSTMVRVGSDIFGKRYYQV